MKDPKEAKELVFFMLEREKYLAKRGANIKRDTEISLLRKVKLVQETSKTTTKVKEEEEDKSSPFSSIIIPE